jgi:23S rRNA (cytosine1962-C5)-methyltransferase
MLPSHYFLGTDMSEKYSLVDSGDQQKLERFGDVLIARPCSQALWHPALPKLEWDKADAHFSRDGGNAWNFKRKLPDSWFSEVEGVRFKISPTDFGHLGVFPEHSLLWNSMREAIRTRKEPPHILNLFAYSGGATLAAASAGARVCHVDASKGMVAWARENAQLNSLASAPIRWIVDDVTKFLTREIKRGVRYDGIILDPPSFGRGSRGEVFKIEKDIHDLLHLCRQLLTEHPLFLMFTTHTPGMTPLVMNHLLKQKMQALRGKIETGEMILPSTTGINVPCGSFAKWSAQ